VPSIRQASPYTIGSIIAMEGAVPSRWSAL
jgi:hypothetical protein